VSLNWALFLNVNITSRRFTGEGIEALMIVDNPTGVGGSISNAVRGSGENSVIWSGVPFVPPETGNQRVIRFTNIRANTSSLSFSPAGATPQIVTFVSASPVGTIALNNPQQLLAYLEEGMTFSTQSGADPNSPLGDKGFRLQAGAGTPERCRESETPGWRIPARSWRRRCRTSRATCAYSLARPTARGGSSMPSL
jgi:hypothetical protein